jgi:Fe-Mn family superoxide dismutase
MKHVLPKLNYDYGALEPYIDAQTMEIHYAKHHQAYVDKLNSVLGKYPKLQEKTAEELLKDLNNLKVDEADLTAIRNNAGGHANHTFFWKIMGQQKEVDQKLTEEIVTAFGSMDEFKKVFSNAAATRFGSGWTWLTRDGTGKLSVYSTANQDSPLTLDHTPIITLDVWEHAYYLKYQNRRPEYIENWWHVLKLL